MTTTELIQIGIQAIGLFSLVILVITYRLDRQWRRTEAAYQFYNEFDNNRNCQLAMFMIDYKDGEVPYKFMYDFPKLSKEVRINYNLSKRQSAMTKPYDRLSEEEQAIRFIFDVYIGYLERVFYCISNRYFTEKELFFYKYWLDKLISDECKDIRDYALYNSCGLFVPFLERYGRVIRQKLNKMLKNIY